jgi:osmotically-inducible protein OsmY
MSTDAELKQDVLAELLWEPSVHAAHIAVVARDGVVSLAGHVASYAEKRGAEAAASRVRGVKALADELDVCPPSNGEMQDDMKLAAAIADRLSWNTSIPQDAVKVEVEKGWVTLSGTVTWHFQSQAAEAEIRHLTGVTGISNLITVKPRPCVPGIGQDITEALKRTWLWDPNRQTVWVTAKDGAVTLSGTVASLHDRQVAASAAWSAPGTTSVENGLTVA